MTTAGELSVWRKNYESLCSQVSDYRVYDKQDVASILLFGFHIVDFLHNHGIEYRGHNLKNMGWATMLVLKVTIGETQLVGFVTEQNPAHCMRIAVRKIEENRMEWTTDKFA